MSGYTVDARIRWTEWIPFVVALAGFFLMPEYLALGSRILIYILFALSLDLILGYAGIITLGHSAFFGLGAYTAGILSAKYGINDPFIGLVAAAAMAALLIGVADTACKYWIPEFGAFLVYVATIALLLWRPMGLFGVRA